MWYIAVVLLRLLTDVPLGFEVHPMSEVTPAIVRSKGNNH